MRGLKFVALALVALLLLPAGAYAEEDTYVDVFLNGLNDTVSPEISNDSKEINDSDVEDIKLSQGQRNVSEGDTIGSINNVTDSFYSVPFESASGVSRTYTPIQLIRVVFVGGSASSYAGFAVTTAVLLVFFWWGMRKAVRMINASFRRGRINV